MSGSADRIDTRAGHYERKLHTKAGEVSLKVPKLRSLPFETQIIERYRRRESSVEEALMEMYLAGVSVRRVEDITEALWGVKVGPSTVSDLNQKIYGQIEEWRNQPIQGKHPYVYLDGLWLKRSLGGTVKNVSVLVAVGVNEDGYREILGVAEGAKWRIRPVGKTSYVISKSEAFRALSWSSAINVWAWSRASASSSPMRPGSVARFIFIVTYGPLCPRAKSRKFQPCSRPSMPVKTLRQHERKQLP